MKYDGQNPLHVEQARFRLEKLIAKGAVFELTECKKRTMRQSDYLFVTIRFWGSQTGYSVEDAEAIYKQLNKDFYFKRKMIAGIETDCILHTYELNKEEMSVSIDRWRNWAAANEECPVYIPSPEEHRLVQLMEMEVERNSNYW